MSTKDKDKGAADAAKLGKAADAISEVMGDVDALANGLEHAMEEASAPLLRDLFAACALMGTDCRGALSPDAIAERCYGMADAMLKRRAETLAPQPLPRAPGKSASRARDAS